MNKRLFWIEKCTACDGEPPKDYYCDVAHLWMKINCSACNGTGETREEVTTPSDDGEAITPQWVKALLPSSSGNGTYRQGQLGNVSWWHGEQFVTLVNGNDFSWRQATKGEFRRLCAAMGVELQERDAGERKDGE
jgi:hypothetical protein